LDGDGRTLISNRELNQAQRDYVSILEGRPENRGTPNCPALCFDHSGGWALQHAHSSLSNTAINQLTIDVTVPNACSGVIMAVHEREFSISRGTILNRNIY
jgi:hypothetical protein